MPTIKIPEPPTREESIQARTWVRWFQEVKRILATPLTTAIGWAEIDFTGSNLTDLATRKHTDLTDLNTTSYTHLTAANHTDLTDAGDSTLHYHASDRDSANFTGTNWTDLTDAGATTLHHHTVAPTFNVGDVAGGDYLEIEADGTLEMHGAATVWRDELGDITQLRTTGPGVASDNAEASITFATNCNATNDYLYANIQFNHDRLLGAVVQPHLHWWQAQNNKPHWLVQYRWQKNGGAKTTAWTNYKMDQLAFTYVSGTLNQISNGAGITPPTGDGISDILQIRLTRDTTSTVYVGADPYTAVAHATSFDVHMEIDTLGSRSEYLK